MRLVLVCLLALGAAGCSDLSTDCQWPAHAFQALDLQDRPDVQHLREDVELAEELSIRYGDVRWSPGPERARRDPECLSPLFSRIARGHSISMDEVLRAREGLADRGLNLMANVPIGLFFGLISWFTIRQVYRRFSPQDELMAVAVACVLAAIMVGAATVGFGRLLDTAVEMARLGNDHLSYRGLRLQWTRYLSELFVFSVFLFWVVALAHAVIRRAYRPKATASGDENWA